MCGNAQPDGCPLVGQNSGAVFHQLWTKVYGIKFACMGVSIVCNAIFRLTMSCYVPEIFAIKSHSCRNRAQILMLLGRQISGGGATQISDQIL